ncbi:LacI family DNA-binding transcriptional regulator [Amycolatopsis sp. H20-H5]|uniref:LacI family DNA-binding transcriptional regulator n=1 Tax=Amycolatopsis sp. H20-H5 TaxID=3046309 RepID=UPI002DBF255D|nr:LacI family DNA-binding transcriptional regulator [Amycolatopsis sp. H20-H5]MEC3974992.1 LacI family DNA-binding transcriptional regulator [Amycolatopsis sp. H20-H5]
MSPERMRREKRATIEDVARVAGVGRQTVSRALNDKAEIAPETRQRVLAAVAELGYRPNAMARGMRTQRSDVIGLVVSDIANPFYPAVARGVYDAAQDAGCSVVLYNTDADPVRERGALEDLLARSARGVVGFFYGTAESVLGEYAKSISLVVADRVLTDPAMRSVSNDFATGTRAAVARLLGRGHRDLGMLDSSVGVALDERRSAFLEACAEAGLGNLSARVVQGAPSIDGGLAASRTLLAGFPQVDGIFAFNDLMGIGAVRAALELGRAVPADCAVVGFDDLPMSALIHPPLTTVRIDKYGHGQALVRTLLTEEPQRLVLPVTLIGRATA